MIDWSVVTPALTNWIIAGTGLELAVMENDKRPFSMHVYARAQVMSVRSVGTDNNKIVTETAVVEGSLVTRRYVKIYGAREFVLRVSVQSSSQDAVSNAAVHIERLRAFYQLDSMRRILSNVNCAVATITESTMADVPTDDNIDSVFYFDVTFNTAFSYVNRTREAGVIEAAELYATLPSSNPNVVFFRVP